MKTTSQNNTSLVILSRFLNMASSEVVYRHVLTPNVEYTTKLCNVHLSRVMIVSSCRQLQPRVA